MDNAGWTGSIEIAPQPYTFHNNRTLMFEITDSHEEGPAPQLQRMFRVGGDWVLVPSEAGDGVVAQEALEVSE